MFIFINRKKMFHILIIFTAAVILFCTANIWVYNGNFTKHTINDPQGLLILVHIDEKTLYLFENEKCIKKYPIASGKPGWPSPIGEWKIVEKSQWGKGFGGRWLGLNVRWGNYGIHGTQDEASIGRPASHGCIRMYNKDIKELYDIVPMGTAVVIRNGPFGPFGTGFRKLMPGDRGADVLAVQERLKRLGFFRGYESGIYEDDLKEALFKFQRTNNLKVKYTITKPDYNAMGYREFE
ncbi:MAG TPA: L,D-transpeptidase family protein [Ruminiclostridium sp.]|nr:L,D-transpeptidase family protein [Ruminiclostridium sp.]